MESLNVNRKRKASPRNQRGDKTLSALDQQDPLLQEIKMAIKQDVCTFELWQEAKEIIEYEMIENPSLSTQYKALIILMFTVCQKVFNDPNPPFKRNSTLG